MKIEIEVYSPDEMDAFGAFLAKAAEARRKQQEEERTRFGLGGIARDAQQFWTHPAEEKLAQGVELARKVEERLNETEAAVAQERIAAVDASPSDPQPEVPAEPKKRGRPAKKAEAKPEPVAEAEPQIRTQPENRVEEPEEDAIQDMADEVAEVEAARDPVNPLTVDDVRQALGGYVKKYGTPAALEDGAKLLAQALGNPPEGEPIWKMSILPDDQDALRKATEAVNAAIEGNPFAREAV